MSAMCGTGVTRKLSGVIIPARAGNTDREAGATKDYGVPLVLPMATCRQCRLWLVRYRATPSSWVAPPPPSASARSG